MRARTQQVRQASLSRLHELFGAWLPLTLLAPAAAGRNSRQRFYPTDLTFWAFLSQVLSPGSSCREIVRKVQAWCKQRRHRAISGDTGAYCLARAKLPRALLGEIFSELAATLKL